MLAQSKWDDGRFTVRDAMVLFGCVRLLAVFYPALVVFSKAINQWTKVASVGDIDVAAHLTALTGATSGEALEQWRLDLSLMRAAMSWFARPGGARVPLSRLLSVKERLEIEGEAGEAVAHLDASGQGAGGYFSAGPCVGSYMGFAFTADEAGKIRATGACLRRENPDAARESTEGAAEEEMFSVAVAEFAIMLCFLLTFGERWHGRVVIFVTDSLNAFRGATSAPRSRRRCGRCSGCLSWWPCILT